MTSKATIRDYNTDVQSLFLRMMVTNPELYTRTMNIFNPDNFDRKMRPVASFIVDHAIHYSVLPNPDQIKASTGEEITKIDDMSDGHNEWFLTEFEQFTKRQELQRAIVLASDLLDKGDFDPVEKLIKDAVQISLQRDMGTDYFADPKSRLDTYFNAGGQVSTGWPQLDRIMFGGMSRGELNVFCGGSGSGKSLVMMNLALNWLSQGMSGVYVSLELSEELTALRTDAMLTSMSTKDIRRNITDTELKVKIAGKKYGKYRVKALPAQSTVNDIRSYIKEVQIQTGIKVDFIMVDYLDLLMPVSVKVNPSDAFTKDKYVSEELRNLSKELQVCMVTASQLNRSSVDEVEFDHSHIAGGISKINTSDFVFGIFTSRAMKERGQYQIQCMKSRGSTGVGHKIDLEYNVDTMRITDPDDDDMYRSSATPSATPPTEIMNKIKQTSKIVSPETKLATNNAVDSFNVRSDEEVNYDTGEVTKKIQADVQSAKLKALLGSLKK